MKSSAKTSSVRLPVVPAGYETVAGRPDWSTMSDDLLVEHARARNETAFAALIDRHRPMLARVCAGLVHDQDAVAEVLQDVYLCSWRNLPKFEGRSQISSWLYRVTSNACLMFLRRRKRLLEVALDDLAGLEPPDVTAYCGIIRGSSPHSPDRLVESDQLQRSIQVAVDDLPPLLRQAFRLRYIDGLSDQESARVLRTTTTAVKTRLHRARLALRENLHSTWLLYAQDGARAA
jgi:RNA polymerase sigma-70 factor (ECF subfamily)